MSKTPQSANKPIFWQSGVPFSELAPNTNRKEHQARSQPFFDIDSNRFSKATNSLASKKPATSVPAIPHYHASNRVNLLTSSRATHGNNSRKHIGKRVAAKKIPFFGTTSTRHVSACTVSTDDAAADVEDDGFRMRRSPLRNWHGKLGALCSGKKLATFGFFHDFPKTPAVRSKPAEAAALPSGLPSDAPSASGCGHERKAMHTRACGEQRQEADDETYSPLSTSGCWQPVSRSDLVVRFLRVCIERPSATHDLYFRCVGGRDSRPYVGNDESVFVSHVTPHSPAENAGLVAGDKILSVNGMNFEGIMHSDAMILLTTLRFINMLVEPITTRCKEQQICQIVPHVAQQPTESNPEVIIPGNTKLSPIFANNPSQLISSATTTIATNNHQAENCTLVSTTLFSPPNLPFSPQSEQAGLPGGKDAVESVGSEKFNFNVVGPGTVFVMSPPQSMTSVHAAADTTTGEEEVERAGCGKCDDVAMTDVGRSLRPRRDKKRSFNDENSSYFYYDTHSIKNSSRKPSASNMDSDNVFVDLDIAPNDDEGMLIDDGETDHISGRKYAVENAVKAKRNNMATRLRRKEQQKQQKLAGIKNGRVGSETNIKVRISKQLLRRSNQCDDKANAVLPRLCVKKRLPVLKLQRDKNGLYESCVRTDNEPEICASTASTAVNEVGARGYQPQCGLVSATKLSRLIRDARLLIKKSHGGTSSTLLIEICERFGITRTRARIVYDRAKCSSSKVSQKLLTSFNANAAASQIPRIRQDVKETTVVTSSTFRSLMKQAKLTVMKCTGAVAVDLLRKRFNMTRARARILYAAASEKRFGTETASFDVSQELLQSFNAGGKPARRQPEALNASEFSQEVQKTTVAMAAVDINDRNVTCLSDKKSKPKRKLSLMLAAEKAEFLLSCDSSAVSAERPMKKARHVIVLPPPTTPVTSPSPGYCSWHTPPPVSYSKTTAAAVRAAASISKEVAVDMQPTATRKKLRLLSCTRQKVPYQPALPALSTSGLTQSAVLMQGNLLTRASVSAASASACPAIKSINSVELADDDDAEQNTAENITKSVEVFDYTLTSDPDFDLEEDFEEEDATQLTIDMRICCSQECSSIMPWHKHFCTSSEALLSQKFLPQNYESESEAGSKSDEDDENSDAGSRAASEHDDKNGQVDEADEEEASDDQDAGELVPFEDLSDVEEDGEVEQGSMTPDEL